MVSYLPALEKTIGEKLAGGSIGKPVFLRAHLQWTADHGLLERLLASALDVSSNWMAAALTRLSVAGSVRSGYLTALAEYKDGQTALVSVEGVHAGQAATLLLLAGQHGTLRFDDLPELAQLSGGAPAASRRASSAVAQCLAGGGVVKVSEQ